MQRSLGQKEGAVAVYALSFSEVSILIGAFGSLIGWIAVTKFRALIRIGLRRGTLLATNAIVAAVAARGSVSLTTSPLRESPDLFFGGIRKSHGRVLAADRLRR